MRIKNILSLIVFSAAFVFSVMLVGLPKNNFYSKLNEAQSAGRNRQNIRTFLLTDINNGRFRDRQLLSIEGVGESFQTASNINQIAETTEEYFLDAQSLSASDLPPDFQAAWQAHLNAWQKQVDYLNEIKETANAYPADNFDAQKPSGRLFKIDSETYRSNDEEIEQSWYQVLRVGRKYGAYVPVQ